MPLPLSLNSGLGMNVTVLLCLRAVFLTTYLYMSSLSAISTRGMKRISISACPPVATSWCCASTRMPIFSRVSTISLRMILLAVRGRNREVAFLVSRLVPEVRAFHATRVPAPLHRVDVVVAFVLVLVEADVIEDEELGFRPEIGGVREPQALYIVLRLSGDVSRIPRIVLARDRVADVAEYGEGLCGQEGIQEGGPRNRLDEHVRLVDRLPPTDARAVEPEALFEGPFFDLSRRHGEMLPQAGEIHEPEIHDLDFLLLDELHDVCRGL